MKQIHTHFSNEKKIPYKKMLTVLIVLSLGFILFTGCIGEQKNTIKISGAFALYPMMGIWAEHYQELHPDIKIDVSAGGAGKGMSDALSGIVNIGMVSREIQQEEIEQGAFWISVAKDAVIGTINTNNPVVDTILTTGVTKQQLVDIFLTSDITTWGQLIGDDGVTNKIRVYTRSDACGASQEWAKYLGNASQDDLTFAADSAIEGDPNLAAAIQNDRYGIGYNNINFIYDGSTKKPYGGLQPIPLDLNENGVLDQDEQFYDSRDDMVDAIANDVYPSPPARALHLVTKKNFTGITKDFVNWILTDGQQYVSDSGYIVLSQDILDTQLTYLDQGYR